MKTNSIYKIMVAVLLLALIFVTILLINTSSNLNTQKESLAYINSQNWASIYRISEQIGSIENVEDFDNYPYHNGVVYNVSDLLIPSFNEAEFGFLRVCYDALLQDIVNGNLNDNMKEDALKLFMNMNNDLSEICAFVVIDNEGRELDFINENSALHNELKTKINDFVSNYKSEYKDLMS